MSLYYYSDGTPTPVGPIPDSEIQRLHATGIVAAQTPVFQDGASDWKVYSDFFSARPQPGTPSGVAPGDSKPASALPIGGANSLDSALTPKKAAMAFGVILLAMLILPLMRVSVKGQVQSFAMISVINLGKGAPMNMPALLALLAPIAGIVVALMRRSSWRTISGIIAAAGALMVYLAVSKVASMIPTLTMGMGSSENAIGGFLLPLAFLALAVVCLLPLFKSKN